MGAAVDEATRKLANAVEARIKTVSRRANGGANLGLEVHADDYDHVKDFLPGMRFLVAFVRIDENENLVRGDKPDLVVEDQSSVRSDSLGVSQRTNVSERPQLDRPEETTETPPRVNLATRAALLVQNRQFQMWCHETFETALTATAADQWLKEKCKIKSKREIVPDSYAASMLTWIRSAFDTWLKENPTSRFA